MENENEQPQERREPPRHAQSNNWRTKSEVTDSPPATSGWRGKDKDTTNGTRTNTRWAERPQRSWGNRTNSEESSALSEGRRIYVGNILYDVRPEDITAVFHENGFATLEQLHLSTDPVTGRNPGYCFVEFPSKEDADAAIEHMNGVNIRNRPMKTGPCNPKPRQTPRQSDRPAFDRWGDSPSRDKPSGNADDTYRVYVGGLDEMSDLSQNEEELREMFKDFKIASVSKRMTPHESTREMPGKHHYAFVDLVNRQEGQDAIRALDGTDWAGSAIKEQGNKI
ncbi:uncharacterized protein F5Z01DRAFT_674154 [Emericellopsis atlantica]|uniref:RRM domain-containing protein n=1 Tax=Emericellopsis atlantica TaxID=2614577 RepID=A0A9P8CPP7_9HYPO|nr:uncharacterized protein F5Z01DRAFT_674154 [Emericellopsis atlantica]KAG9254412.1 hypothetical protein F5Z01DRAFT_674154 [Emericellopsis atlantica]